MDLELVAEAGRSVAAGVYRLRERMPHLGDQERGAPGLDALHGEMMIRDRQFSEPALQALGRDLFRHDRLHVRMRAVELQHAAAGIAVAALLAPFRRI